MPPRARPAAPLIPPTQSGSSDDDGVSSNELALLLAKMEKSTYQRRDKARAEIEKGFNDAMDQFIADAIEGFKVEAEERKKLRGERLIKVMEYVEARQKAEEEIVGFLKRLESEIGGYVRTVGGRLEELATGVEKGDGEERDTEGGNTEMEV